jgi:very-short-patch-repair endonuclease
MVTCFICQKEFINNVAGQLTCHVKEEHTLEFKEYIILSKYNGMPPRCACNLCDEMPVFHRGKFLKYAKFHQRFDEKKKRWIEKFGKPTCQKCGNDVEFVRGEPKDYCSSSCSVKDRKSGFLNPEVQKKIIENVYKLHGVKNISQVDYVKRKISKSRIGKRTRHTDSSKLKISIASKERWKDDTYRKKVSHLIHTNIMSNHEEILRRKNAMIDNHKNDVYVEKMWLGNKNRLSKLHSKIRNLLNLDDFGFKSEQKIESYWVDELNEERKIIIEIYGDYTHANPTSYKENDIILLRGQKYSAGDKWESDKKRADLLIQKGYKLLIIWESDDLKEIEKELKFLFEN